ASISSSVRGRAAARSANSFSRSMSVQILRTIGIALSPLGAPQADDAASLAPVGEDAHHDKATDDPRSPPARFAVIAAIIWFDHDVPAEQLDRQFERQVAAAPIALA